MDETDIAETDTADTNTDAPRGTFLSIGAFARETRLTQKALRLYDALGLLVPARTDPESGYRSYEPGQAARARLIGLLRRLGMPLARIAEVLDLPGPDAARAIGRFWREAEREQAERRRLVQYLDGHLQGRGEVMYEVQERDVPEQKVLTLQRHVYVKDLEGFLGAAGTELLGALGAAGLASTGPSFVIFHHKVDDDNDGPVEVCVPFEGRLDPVGEQRLRREPAHREAYARITAAQLDFPGILDAYDAVAAHLHASGRGMAGPPREVYFADPRAAAPDEPCCDVAWPMA